MEQDNAFVPIFIWNDEVIRRIDSDRDVWDSNVYAVMRKLFVQLDGSSSAHMVRHFFVSEIRYAINIQM